MWIKQFVGASVIVWLDSGELLSSVISLMSTSIRQKQRLIKSKRREIKKNLAVQY